ncbi:MAG: HIRAN domain-containing protein [Faecousia sp.]
MNWQIIVGVIFLIGGIGNITKDFTAFLFGVIAGLALLYWGLRRKGYFKKVVTQQQEIDGYVLAYSYEDVKFYPPADIVSKINKNKLQVGAELRVVQEPSNSYDHNAVALYLGNQKIGYLLKNRLQDMANDFIQNGWPVKATLAKLKKAKGDYQGYIALSFYRPGTQNGKN